MQDSHVTEDATDKLKGLEPQEYSSVWTKSQQRLHTIKASSREISNPESVILQAAWKPEIWEQHSLNFRNTLRSLQEKGSPKTPPAPIYCLVLVSPRGIKCVVRSANSHKSIFELIGLMKWPKASITEQESIPGFPALMGNK